MQANFNKKFLTNTDDTGRFIVTSKRTGKKYYVEPIGSPRVEWGSINPLNNNELMVKKGWGKNKGSIEPEESLITMENGFSKIHELKAGISPLAYIDMLDKEYPDKQ